MPWVFDPWFLTNKKFYKLLISYLNMKPAYILLILIGAAIFLGGCTRQVNISSQTFLSDACIQACENALSSGKNIESGPCLFNPYSQDKNWVCDVAHEPRQAIDNLQENQCEAFRKGTAKHFIEVTQDCKIIRIIN